MVSKTWGAFVGDYEAGHRPRAAQEAADHASARLGIPIEQQWFNSEELLDPSRIEALRRFHRVWVVPGSPYRSLAGVLSAIRVAREAGIPLLGTCAGFQHLILEYVRNVLGYRDAVHAEYEADAEHQVISRLSCPLVGRAQSVRFEKGSNLAEIYGRAES